MIISSEFSNDELQPGGMTKVLSESFNKKITNIQKAINNAISYLNITNTDNVPLKMKVTLVTEQQQGGGTKKMRQTKKMKKRKH